MSSPDDENVPIPEGEAIPVPEGKALGMPYDWRRPTTSRARARLWNPDDPRLFTPKSFGWGYTLNLYRLFHWRRPR